MKVVGIRRIDISSDKGEVHGYKYYCNESDPNVSGFSVDSFFVSDRLLSSLPRDIALEDEVVPVYKKESKALRTVVFL